MLFKPYPCSRQISTTVIIAAFPVPDFRFQTSGINHVKVLLSFADKIYPNFKTHNELHLNFLQYINTTPMKNNAYFARFTQ